MKCFLILFIFTSCNLGNQNKTLLNRKEIVSAEINQVGDSVSKQMSPREIELFVTKWNTSRSRGIIKFLAQYNVAMYLKNGDTVTFRTHHDLIKQSGDATYTTNDRDFFSNLYRTAK